MKPSAYFVSLGRGAVIDEVALDAALREQRIGGAACDVFAAEPLPADSPLWERETMLLTAHNADLTDDYFTLGFGVWRDNLKAFLEGMPLVTPVDLALRY